MKIKEQFYDWKYLISKDNTTSRGFYLFMTTVMVILLVAAVAMFVVSAIGIFTGVLRVVGFIAPIIAIAVLVLIVVMLSK